VRVGAKVTVDVIGWTRFDAVALVDGVRCRIRQNTTETRWLCDAHPEQWCDHLEALNAAQPFDPQRQNHSNKSARRQARQEVR